MSTVMSANFAFPVSGDRAYQSANDVPPHAGHHIAQYTHGGSEYLQFAHEDAFAVTGTGAASGPSAPGMYHAPSLIQARMHRSESVSSAGNSAYHIDTPSSDYQFSPLDDTPILGDISPISARDSQSAEPSAVVPILSSKAAKTATSERRPSYGKSRKEKLRLELAPDQPLTTQGRPRCRVYVACVQCRSRKIRCDGAKPICHNCSRRSDQTSHCTYDAEPKRRGPDKTPGARQRSLTGSQEGEPRRRTRRRTDDDPSPANTVDSKVKVPTHDAVPPIAHSLPSPSSLRGLSPPTTVRRAPTASQASASGSRDEYASGSRHTALDAGGAASTSMQPLPVSAPVADIGSYPQVNTYSSTNQSEYSTLHASSYSFPIAAQQGGPYDHRSPLRHGIPADPSSQYARETWWEVVLSRYSSTYEYSLGYPAPLAPGVRQSATQRVNDDLRLLFRYSSYWLSFLNIPYLLRRLRDPEGRKSIQPSFVLGALALATFLQSSNSENSKGAAGRERALRLKNEAQSALEASLASRWIDDNLVQAAWLLAFFEVCSHPLHTSERVRSAVTMLDSLIRYMRLSSLDANDPRVTRFAPRTAPVVSAFSQPQTQRNSTEFVAAQQAGTIPLPQNMASKCWCANYTLGNTSPDTIELAPLWSHTAGWLAHWTEGDIRREECRRLVWSSVILIAGYASYNTATGKLLPELALMNPSNIAVLFPGESIFSTSEQHSKDTVWALYMRSLLLWNGCVYMRNDASMADTDKAQYAIDVWLEIDKIEVALNQHTCNIERTFMFVSRDYLFISRLYLYYELQRLVPHIQQNAQQLRRRAEEWLTHHDSMARRTMYGLHTVTGQTTSSLAGRPFYVFWFMGQIMRMVRMVTLWSSDQTLLIALQAGKSLIAPLEYLVTLWPSDEVQRRFNDVQERLVEACRMASITLPVPTPMSARFLGGTI